jgi:GNAT superfamily N-acetyltransferase
MDLAIVEVKCKKHINDFLGLPIKLYKNCKNWIRPLDDDIEEVFDKKKNKSFRHGECIRWNFYKNNEIVGRIAAFYDKKTALAKGNKQPTGGIGFFECINDQELANLMFDTAKNWLSSKGMKAMDGSINFGERDRWWGLLAQGFEYEPNYRMPYTHPYYIQLFENYGFKLYFRQYTFWRAVTDPLPEIYAAKAERIEKDPNYAFQCLRKNDLEKFAEDFRYIYNKAWVKHAGVAQMSKSQALAIIKSMKPILDPDIIWFAYYSNEPIAFFIMIPELNQIIKHLNGKLKGTWDIYAKIKFLWLKRTGVCRKMFGVAFGVIPEFQGKGIESAIVVAAGKKIQPMGKYDEFEMNWIGDFNPKMIHVAESAGGKIRKIHHTYRFLFDPSAEFERAPIIN